MSLIKDAIDIIVPYRCDVCGGFADIENNMGRIDLVYSEIYGQTRDFHICSSCLSELIPQAKDKRWFTCLSNPIEDDPYPDLTLFMPFAYSGVVSKALPMIKFGGKIGIARLLGILLGFVVKSEGIISDIIIPVPLSPERMEERGYNQAYEIAYPLSRITGIPLVNDILRRTRNTGKQSEINDAMLRAVNVSGAFGVNETWDIEGLRVLLTDDVATTGHTLREAASVLLEAGAKDVLCCAFSGNRQVKNAEPF